MINKVIGNVENISNNQASPSQYDIVLGSYLLEAERLAHTIESGMFARIQPRFEDFSGYIDSLVSTKPHKLLRVTKNKSIVLDIKNHSEAFEEILASANLAACCELFNGVRFQLDNFDREGLKSFVTQHFNNVYMKGEQYITQYFDRLNSADAIRTIETLRLLGLVGAETHRLKQLSFGVGNATKDIRSIHLVPVIRRRLANAIIANSSDDAYDFYVQQLPPTDVVLVDNHPQAKAFFDQINKEHGGRVKAYNKDANMLLKDLARAIKNGELAPRDLLVSLRFDHLMLPDVDYFFKLVHKVIAEKADLIMSIGAGHADEEFRGRLRTMDEIVDCLKEKRLSPVRIKLYRGKTTKEKRERPGLGAPQYATYEILYCKLTKHRS